ncbi:MarR family winged helix-turn-helix transcriptional regulator [Microbacterium testaceum]|uniref:MarR family winged helix-turn-helix transcriptional regulator n=1 Tax=Microbacterium testaceum TaxID=2033 RepID=UPI0024358AED|nr:MarR family transcriptional regulator [Microbacterium testaceum]
MDDGILHTAGLLAHQLGPLRRAVLRASRSAADLPDIPDAQIEVMRSLATTGESAPSDLADTLGLARSTISNLISHMEKADLIERHLVAGDGRRTRVGLTPLAETRLRAFDDSAAHILSVALRDLSANDVAAIAAALPALDRLQHSIVDG